MDVSNHILSSYREKNSTSGFEQLQNSPDKLNSKQNSFTRVLTLDPTLVQNKQEFVKILPIEKVNCFEFQNFTTNTQPTNESLETSYSYNTEDNNNELSTKTVLAKSSTINNSYTNSNFNPNNEIGGDTAYLANFDQVRKLNSSI